MSLPSAEQRILDGIAESLRVSEPRLDAMYATFARLTRNAPRPRRERLRSGPAARLTAAARRVPGCQTPSGRRVWLRVMAVAQLAVALIVLVVLVGLSAGPGWSCTGGRVARTAPDASARCYSPAGLVP